MLDVITPLIITYNEEPNIARVIAKLAWARQIIIVDSGSTDGTLDVLAKVPQAKVIIRRFDNFADQCNFGLGHVSTEWALSLDADYVLSDALIDELGVLSPEEDVAGYRARFVYCIYGQALRGTLYPPRTVLYRKALAQYSNEGHGHRVGVAGRIGWLRNVIYHDDHKPLARWLSSQQRYARQEADFLTTRSSKLSATDRIRAMGWLSPILVLTYTLFAKRCIFDGWAGWHYALQRTIFEVLTTIELVDRRLRVRAEGGPLNRGQITDDNTRT